ncbi:DUF742 domain-containing protein [Streptacidiphilus sp. ASG 303]|uniref:DUF742 domain-containing protein n=1 Tax=Streptacidiphilus sp. ASG 303 TaxID=2896847 RepID=UPI0027E0B0E0|nr:DUF742 domain-containing protein [Streptacidiphilus sp. ASG 303]
MIDTEWVDEEAGPLVRPYAMVRGRTRSRQEVFDLVAFVVAAVDTLYGWVNVEPEHSALLSLCRRPLSVGELSARTDLPVGVVRVLLGDLLDMGAIRLREPAYAGGRPSLDLIREVLDGLRAL